MKKYKVAVVGATGRIGNDIVNILAERKFPISQLTPISSSNSAGRDVVFGNQKIKAIDIDTYNFSNDEIIFFALDEDLTKHYIKKAFNESRGLIIDNSSQFRMQPEVALTVHGVNDEKLNDFAGRIIANPNCSVIPLVILLDAIVKNSSLKIKHVNVATYQSVSGAGTKAMNELLSQTKEKFGSHFGNGEEEKVFDKQIAFNCIPKIGNIMSGGYTSEELKIMNEPRKILEIPDLKINATCVRVPVFVGHGAVVDIEFEDDGEPINYNELYEIIDSHDLIDIADHSTSEYYTPIDCVKREEVLISRLRIDPTVKKGISLWMVSDNLYLGGSLNAVKIAEKMTFTEN